MSRYNNFFDENDDGEEIAITEAEAEASDEEGREQAAVCVATGRSVRGRHRLDEEHRRMWFLTAKRVLAEGAERRSAAEAAKRQEDRAERVRIAEEEKAAKRLAKLQRENREAEESWAKLAEETRAIDAAWAAAAPEREAEAARKAEAAKRAAVRPASSTSFASGPGMRVQSERPRPIQEPARPRVASTSSPTERPRAATHPLAPLSGSAQWPPASAAHGARPSPTTTPATGTAARREVRPVPPVQPARRTEPVAAQPRPVTRPASAPTPTTRPTATRSSPPAAPSPAYQAAAPTPARPPLAVTDSTPLPVPPPPALPVADEPPPFTGADLAAYRRTTGLSQGALATRLGVTQGTVSKAEGNARAVLGPALRTAMWNVQRGLAG